MPITPPDPSTDRRHALDPARKDDREATVWVMALPEHQLGLVAYTWVDAFGQAGAMAVAFGPRFPETLFERYDGLPVADDATYEDWTAGDRIRFAMSEPQGTSEVHYAGERVTMDFTFEPLHVPYSYAQHPEPFPAWYADDRLEQGGRARGTATIDGERIAFDGFAHRDHSWGARTWGAVSHYKWLNFLAGDTSIHVMDTQGFGHSTVRGYVHRDGVTAEITDAVFDYDLDERDFFHRRLEVTLTDDTGRITRARLTSSDAEATYPVSPTVQLVDVVGTCEIEGRPGVSYAEMGWATQYLATNTTAAAPAAAAH